MEADSRIGDVQVALVDYTINASLRFNLTSDLTVFSGLTRGSSGSGTENALGAIDFAINSAGINYRQDSVKSIILITNEDADDDRTYSNASGDGASALAAMLDDTGFLNNVIYEFSDSGTEEFDTIARPNGATFDIDEFRANPTAFADTKLQEIVDVGGGGGGANVVPLPASSLLLLAGLGGLGVMRRRK